jgi:hypothetical protein
VRGPWKTDPHGIARPARLCCIAMSAGGLGVIPAALGRANAPGGPCERVRVGRVAGSWVGVGRGKAVVGALQGWGHLGSRGRGWRRCGAELDRCRLPGAGSVRWARRAAARWAATP